MDELKDWNGIYIFNFYFFYISYDETEIMKLIWNRVSFYFYFFLLFLRELERTRTRVTEELLRAIGGEGCNDPFKSAEY